MTTPEKPLSFICVGAGAIGGYVSASLLAAGHRVTIIERPHNIEVLRADGLVVQHLDGSILQTMPELFPSFDALTALRNFDLIILALKSFDTPAFLDSVTPFLNQLPPVLSLQNGIDNERLLAAHLGPDRVIAGTVTTAVGKQAVGRLIIERLRGIGIAGAHPLTRKLMLALNTAGLNPRHYPDAASMKWSKLLTNLVANATSAILDMTPAQIYASRVGFEVERAMMREALHTLTALGHRVTDLPGTPVRAMASAFRALPPGLARPLLARAIGSGRGGKMPSLHMDLHGGRKSSEVTYLNGAVVRAARQAGLSAPINETLERLLTVLINDPNRAADFRHNPEALARATLP